MAERSGGGRRDGGGDERRRSGGGDERRRAEARTEGVEEALARAAGHARAALAEAIAAAEALLDAATIAGTGAPARASGLAPVGEALAGARAWLDREGGREGRLLDAVLAALDEEIARWEARSGRDPDARAVLRAFLTVRELLWEVAHRTTRAGASTGDPRDPTRPPRGGGGRLRRVRVEG